MASPVDAGRQSTAFIAATSWNPGFPAGVVVGDLLVMMFRAGAAATVTSIDGAGNTWTQLLADSSDATDETTYVYYTKVAVQASPTINLSASVKGAAIIWRITGAADPATQAPQVSTVQVFTTAANTGNAPAISPTGGSKDYLFLTCIGYGGVGIPTGIPANYSSGAWIGAVSSGGSAATNCVVHGVSRQVTTATEDVGVWTHPAATVGGSAFTIAIHPAAPPGPQTKAVTGLGSAGAFGTVLAKFPPQTVGVGGVRPSGVGGGYQNMILADGPAGYWRLGASPLTDLSGNGGTLTNPTTAPVAAASLLPAETDQSRDFDGSKVYVAANSASLTLTPPYSLEAWIRGDVLPAGFDRDLVVGIDRVIFRVNCAAPNSNFHFYYYDGGWRGAYGVGAAIQVGGIYHLVAVDTGTNIQCYVNGVQVQNTARATGGMNTPTTDIAIGGIWQPGIVNGFQGGIDEVAIYKKALTAAQVQAHYNMGASGALIGSPVVSVFVAGPPQTVPVDGISRDAGTTPTIVNEFIVGDGHLVGGSAVTGEVLFGVPIAKLILVIPPAGVPSAQAFGTVTTAKGPVSRTVTGLGSAQAFGAVTTAITRVPQTVAVTGRGTAQSFGVPVITTTISKPSAGVSSAQAFGTIAAFPDLIVQPPGLWPNGFLPSLTGQVTSGDGHVSGGNATAQFGVPTALTLTAGQVLGLGSAQAFGTPIIRTAITRTVVGLGSAQSFGTPTVRTSVVKPAGGVPSAQQFGAISTGGTSAVVVSGKTSSQAFGTVTVKAVVVRAVVGLGSAQAFGTVTYTTGGPAPQTKLVGGVNSAQQFGSPVSRQGQTVQVQGLPQVVGVPSITGGVVSGDGHVCGGIGSLWGFVTIRTTVTRAVPGLGTGQQFGQVTPTWPQTVSVSSVSSAQTFGRPVVAIILRPVYCDPLTATVVHCTDLTAAVGSCENLTVTVPATGSLTSSPAGTEDLVLTEA